MLTVLFSAVIKVLTCCLILLAGGWCWFQWSHRQLIRTASALPSLHYKPMPLIGHAHLTIFGMERLTQYCMEMVRECVVKGIKTTCFWCGPLPLVLVLDQHDIKKILTSSTTSEKGDEMEYMKWAFGDGLVTAPGHIWKITRRHINPLFQTRNLDLLMPMFNRNSRELVSNLSRHVDQGPVDIMEPTKKVALKTVCHLVFGPDMEFDVKSPEFQGLLTIVESFHVLFIKRILQPWLRINSIFQFFYENELETTRRLWEKFSDIPLKTTKAKNEMKYIKDSSPADNRFNEVVHIESEDALNLLDVYSVLQKKYPQFTDGDLQDEMVTFYNAGTDNVTVGICTCLLALAKYPSLQERLYEEISSVMGPDDDVTTHDLSKMVYLDQVIKETLRWATIIPFVMRKTLSDVKLSTCTIPSNTTVIACLAGPLMDPKIYSDPLAFDPERFSAENTTGKESSSFMPFSGGPRNCIGKSYSILLMKVAIVHVLRKYRLSTQVDIHNMRRRLVITLASSDGYHLSVETRH